MSAPPSGVATTPKIASGETAPDCRIASDSAASPVAGMRTRDVIQAPPSQISRTSTMPEPSGTGAGWRSTRAPGTLPASALVRPIAPRMPSSVRSTSDRDGRSNRQRSLSRPLAPPAHRSVKRREAESGLQTTPRSSMATTPALARSAHAISTPVDRSSTQSAAGVAKATNRPSGEGAGIAPGRLTKSDVVTLCACHWPGACGTMVAVASWRAIVAVG